MLETAAWSSTVTQTEEGRKRARAQTHTHTHTQTHTHTDNNSSAPCPRHIPHGQDIAAPPLALVVRDAVPGELQVPVEAADAGGLGATVVEAQGLVLDDVDDGAHHVGPVRRYPV